MSAGKIADRVVKEIRDGAYDFFAVNFANGDMVGHTGNLSATMRAVEVVDACVGRIVEAVLEKGGCVCVTADHGNAEEVKNLQTNEVDKEHSTNPVPFLLIGAPGEGTVHSFPETPNADLSLSPPVGVLADVAPTVLKVMGIDPPREMTGTALFS
jgi:2,3-bisphosphoglycerate-independent phosphoglycerate mutase